MVVTLKLFSVIDAEFINEISLNLKNYQWQPKKGGFFLTTYLSNDTFFQGKELKENINIVVMVVQLLFGENVISNTNTSF